MRPAISLLNDWLIDTISRFVLAAVAVRICEFYSRRSDILESYEHVLAKPLKDVHNVQKSQKYLGTVKCRLLEIWNFRLN